MSATKQQATSSVVKAYDYDATKQELTIDFMKGDSYVYEGVQQQTYDDLHAASSKGHFFSNSIKDKFTFKKV